MLIIILFQCFINVYGVAYYPLGEYDLDTGMLEIDLEFDEPRWVTINHPHAHPWPANAPYPNCILGPEHFWYYEEHPDIVGNGTRENPTGPYANYPRYYIIKRRATIPRVPNPPAQRIQILALTNPVLQPMRGQQDKFHNQLLSLYCERGFIETIHQNSRIQRPLALGPDGIRRPRLITYGTCGIEQKLIEICLSDLDVGPLPIPTRDSLLTEVSFDIHLNRYIPTPQDRVQQFIQLARDCESFFVIELPSSISLNQQRGTTSRNFQLYLSTAHQARFDFVIMNGLNIGPGCAYNQLGWESYNINQIANNEQLRTELIRKTTQPGMLNQWYFCKSNQ